MVSSEMLVLLVLLVVLVLLVLCCSLSLLSLWSGERRTDVGSQTTTGQVREGRSQKLRHACMHGFNMHAKARTMPLGVQVNEWVGAALSLSSKGSVHHHRRQSISKSPRRERVRY